MRRRGGLATVLVAGTLMATAPGQAHAAAHTGSPHPATTAAVTGWAEEAMPAGNASLRQVTRVDDDTVWAVGSRTYGQGRERYTGPVLFARDDTSASWRELDVPDGLGTETVDADRTGGVWMTGSTSGAADTIPTGHYDRTGWHIQNAPVPDGVLAAGFTGLAPAGGPDDVWAVGTTEPGDFLTFLGLIEHWDGTAWRQVEPPAIDSDYWTLSDVVATGPGDVWAAGTIGTPEGRVRPLLLHYDGQSWTRVAAPALDGRYGGLTALAAVGPGDVWAIGSTSTGDAAQDHPLAVHYDGRAWTPVDTGIAAGRLHAVSVGENGDVTVVGDVYADEFYRPTGAHLFRGRWAPLDLPASDSPEGRSPTGVVNTGRGVTVVGLAPQGPDAVGEPLPTLPFAVTRG